MENRNSLRICNVVYSSVIVAEERKMSRKNILECIEKCFKVLYYSTKVMK